MKKLLLLSLVLALSCMAIAQNSPFIRKVYDFRPAPGQFVNVSPKAFAGITKDSLLNLVAEELSSYNPYDDEIEIDYGMVSLGAFGGYVIFGFDHPVVNVKGEYDFQIFGNAVQANETTSAGGSSEPGIVLVSRDVNGNGVPDDPWYELAGSEYNNPRVQKHFTITYYKPDENKPKVPEPPFITDAEYIRWTCNSVDSLQEGYVRKNSFHNQSYWPLWEEGETMTFEATKLPCNAVDESGNGSYWVQHFFSWGYVDNRHDWHYGYKPTAYNENMNMGFKIDWAVDEDGNHVDLKQIDFIKVYNAVLQDCGWLGETSTEVRGGLDLHPDAVAEPDEVPGDVNGDGNVTAADITALYNHLLNSDETYLSTSDVNGDGNITSADITAVYNILLGN